jgi:hypothetical protein
MAATTEEIGSQSCLRAKTILLDEYGSFLEHTIDICIKYDMIRKNVICYVFLIFLNRG